MMLSSLIIESCRNALKLQSAGGSMPEGRNGPWNDVMTPMRNTAHWGISFLKAHELSGEGAFLKACRRCLDFLALPENLVDEKYFYARRGSHDPARTVDYSNGLVGQAWVIEALALCGLKLGEKYVRIAESVFLNHCFDEDRGLWKRFRADGSDEIMYTVNQQVWFAAAGCLLPGKAVKDRVDLFIQNLGETLSLGDDGFYDHVLSGGDRRGIKGLRERFFKFMSSDIRQERRNLEVGYHSFLLYGLGMIYESTGGRPAFFESEDFFKSLDTLNSPGYLEAVSASVFGFQYNPTGFEAAYLGGLFNHLLDEAIDEVTWIKRQVEGHYNSEPRLMDRGSIDSQTLSARLYEAVRIKDVEI